MVIDKVKLFWYFGTPVWKSASTEKVLKYFWHKMFEKYNFGKYGFGKYGFEKIWFRENRFREIVLRELGLRELQFGKCSVTLQRHRQI